MASARAVEIDDVEMSNKGMQLLLNNDLDASQALFDHYRFYSPLMHSGWALVSFMRAVISFDDQRLTQAGRDLADTEKLCASEKTNKFTRPLIDSDSKKLYEENITRRIIIADCKLCQAILTLIKQELTGLIGAGLLMRKAWKLYEHVHNELFDLYRAKDLNAERDYGSKVEDVAIVRFDNAANGKTSDSDGSNGIEDEGDDISFKSFDNSNDNVGNELSLATVKRLLGSVSFGYGLFQIALSFVPPRIMRIIKFLGFEGDRKIALIALRFCSQSADLKAPFANLTLLWYHCVIQPFFAIDITAQQDTSEAEAILRRNLNKYDKSTLFIYFQGRVERLQKNLPQSLSTFLSGLQPSTTLQNTASAKPNNNELEQILVYDIGICHLMMLNFRDAFSSFNKLKDESRWSKAFYSYICAVCMSAMDDSKTSAAFVKEGIKMLQKRSNPVELFVQKRLDYLKKNPPSKSTAHVLVFEMLYLWTTLPLCEVPTLGKMLKIIENYGQDSNDDPKLRSISCLLEGAIHTILRHFDEAENCYEEALARTDDSKVNFTRYVAPFATCELGILQYLFRQDPDRAKELLTRAREKYSEFDFDNRLQIRALATLKMITAHQEQSTTAAAAIR